MSACLTCNSSRVLTSGARSGALWCFVKRHPVNPDSLCLSFVEAVAGGRDHELVKSDPKAHFDPFSHQKNPHAAG